MAAITINGNVPASTGTSLTTALQQLSPASDVEYVDFYAADDCYLVIDDDGTDGGSISGLNRFLIPGGTVYPIPAGMLSTKIFVAAVSTATAYFLGIGR